MNMGDQESILSIIMGPDVQRLEQVVTPEVAERFNTDLQRGFSCEKKVDFECSCGSTEYESRLQEPVRLGGCNFVDYYYCKVCGVHFNDPEQYTEARKGLNKKNK